MSNEDVLLKLQDIFRRLTALEKKVMEELGEDFVELDSRVDTLESGIAVVNTRLDQLTNNLTTLTLMTGGLERVMDKLANAVDHFIEADRGRHDKEDAAHAAILEQLAVLTARLPPTS